MESLFTTNGIAWTLLLLPLFMAAAILLITKRLPGASALGSTLASFVTVVFAFLCRSAGFVGSSGTRFFLALLFFLGSLINLVLGDQACLQQLFTE